MRTKKRLLNGCSNARITRKNTIFFISISRWKQQPHKTSFRNSTYIKYTRTRPMAAHSNNEQRDREEIFAIYLGICHNCIWSLRLFSRPVQASLNRKGERVRTTDGNGARRIRMLCAHTIYPNKLSHNHLENTHISRGYEWPCGFSRRNGFCFRARNGSPFSSSQISHRFTRFFAYARSFMFTHSAGMLMALHRLITASYLISFHGFIRFSSFDFSQYFPFFFSFAFLFSLVASSPHRMSDAGVVHARQQWKENVFSQMFCSQSRFST